MQAQYAPVAPIHILEELLRRVPEVGFSKYHLLLAHHTAENASRFATLFLKASQNRNIWNNTVIMDNSVVELGGAVDDNAIQEACEAIFPYAEEVVPVLPDVIGDGPATNELSLNALHRWSQDALMGRMNYMVLLQGATWQDFVESAHFWLDEKLPKLAWIGIPRHHTDNIGSRKRAVEYVKMLNPNINIHLFGFSENMEDDFLTAQQCKVRGIDSAVPVRMDSEIYPFSKVDKRDPGWFDGGVLKDQHIKNIIRVRQWIG